MEITFKIFGYVFNMFIGRAQHVEQSVENIAQPLTDFEKRIELLKQEIQHRSTGETKSKVAEVRVKSGVIYDLPHTDPPSIYDYSDVEVITPEFERLMEERAFNKRS